MSVSNCERVGLAFIEVGDGDLIGLLDHGSWGVQSGVKSELLG
jgi:hypothetical protein